MDDVLLVLIGHFRIPAKNVSQPLTGYVEQTSKMQTPLSPFTKIRRLSDWSITGRRHQATSQSRAVDAAQSDRSTGVARPRLYRDRRVCEGGVYTAL